MPKITYPARGDAERLHQDEGVLPGGSGLRREDDHRAGHRPINRRADSGARAARPRPVSGAESLAVSVWARPPSAATLLPSVLILRTPCAEGRCAHDGGNRSWIAFARRRERGITAAAQKRRTSAMTSPTATDPKNPQQSSGDWPRHALPTTFKPSEGARQENLLPHRKNRQNPSACDKLVGKRRLKSHLSRLP
jgi:hypothetical protein